MIEVNVNRKNILQNKDTDSTVAVLYWKDRNKTFSI